MADMSTELPIVNYGIIGVGLMGMEHIRNILCLEGIAITCIADNFPGSLDACTAFLVENDPESRRRIHTFTTAEALFQSRLCHVVVIATPNHTHHDVLLQAFEHGDPHLRILVEKPLCTTVQDCRIVLAAARGHRGVVHVGLEYRYMPPVARVIRDAQAGVVGDPRMVSIREHRFPFLIKVRNWNRLSCNTGGTFVEKCCHFFDLFNRILHPHVPHTVFASGAQDVNHLDEVYDGQHSDVFDNGYVIVEYTNGRRACLDLCMFAEASHSQEEVCIVGPKGKLEAFLPQLEVRTGIRERDSCGDVKVETVDDERIKYRGHHFGSSYLEHLDILTQVRNHSESSDEFGSTASLYQGLLSVAIGVAAHQSVDEGRVVAMEELLTDEELQNCKYALGKHA